MFVSAMATAIIGHVLALESTSLKVDLNEYACMVEAIHFEAKGETYEGKVAVGHVIMNRVASSRFPDTICGVVKQDYQFSYRNGGAKPVIDVTNSIEERSLHETAKVAFLVVNGTLDAHDHGCDHYYAHNKVEPYWVSAAKYETIVGNHTFVKL